MSLTLREQRRIVLLCAVWILVSIVAVVTGAFGTGEMLGLPRRAIYWASVVGFSIITSEVTMGLTAGANRPRRAAFWALYVVIITSGVYLINRAVFGYWPDEISFGRLLGMVGIIVGVVHLGLAVLAYANPPVDKVIETDPSERFLKRIPIAQRGRIARIEAQDHYLNVTTSKGEALILMRLGEAIAELEGVAGLQVHRSHWVALGAIKGHRREKGRDLLVMGDGAVIPVSRSHREAAKAAGLF